MARLHEYQGKAILAANGFKIPRGRAASSCCDSERTYGREGRRSRDQDSSLDYRARWH